MTASYRHISVEKGGGGVNNLILDRPPLNVMNTEMMEEIVSALEGFAADEEGKVLVVKAVGKAFSAGVDVEDHIGEKATPMIKTFHRMFELLETVAYPTVALVEGASLGGGCELATFCDMVLASEKAKFSQPEIKVGVLAPIAVIRFQQLSGPAKTLELLLTGDTISAAEAKEIGLVTKVWPPETFKEEASKFIESLVSLSLPVLKLTKKAIRETAGKPFEEALKTCEKIYLGELMQTEDAEEGLKAFLEKRTPVWKNR